MNRPQDIVKDIFLTRFLCVSAYTFASTAFFSRLKCRNVFFKRKKGFFFLTSLCPTWRASERRFKNGEISNTASSETLTERDRKLSRF
jgi:hypothetical protein